MSNPKEAVEKFLEENEEMIEKYLKVQTQDHLVFGGPRPEEKVLDRASPEFLRET